MSSAADPTVAKSVANGRSATLFLARVAACALLVAAAVVVWFEPRMTGDTYMVLAGGRDVLDGKLGEPDDWAATTNGRVWMNQNWGTSVLFFVTYDYAGEHGLLVLKAVLIGLVIAGSLLAARQIGAPLDASMIVVAAMLLAQRYYIDLRPNLVGLAGVSVLMWLVFRSAGRVKQIWWAVGWVTVWSHMHGSYVFAILMLALWSVCDFALARWRRAPKNELIARVHGFAAVAATMILAVVTSPYGLRNVTQPFNSMGGEEGRLWRTIYEWQPIFSNRPLPLGSPRELFLALGLLAGAAVSWVLYQRYYRRPAFEGFAPPRRLMVTFSALLFGIAFTMAANASRLIPIALLVAAPLVSLAIGWLLRVRGLALLTAVSVPCCVLLSFALDDAFAWLAERKLTPEWTWAKSESVQDWLVASRLSWPLVAVFMAVLPFAVYAIALKYRPPATKLRGRKSQKKRAPAIAPAPSAVAMLVLLVALGVALWPPASYQAWWYAADNPYVRSTSVFGRMVKEHEFPVDAMTFVEANGIKGNAFNDWRWEGYIHWRCPEVKVYAGGRARQVYDIDTYRSFNRLERGPTLAGAAEEGMYLAILSRREQLLAWQSSYIDGARWVPIFFDGYTWVLVHRNHPQAERLIEGARTGKLVYPSDAIARHSRAACLISPVVAESGTQIAKAVKSANSIRPLPRTYGFVGQSTLSARVKFGWSIPYLEQEARRLEQMDYHQPYGFELLESRATMAKILATLYRLQRSEDEARIWSQRQQRLELLMKAVMDRTAEPEVAPLPPVTKRVLAAQIEDAKAGVVNGRRPVGSTN